MLLFVSRCNFSFFSALFLSLILFQFLILILFLFYFFHSSYSIFKFIFFIILLIICSIHAPYMIHKCLLIMFQLFTNFYFFFSRHLISFPLQCVSALLLLLYFAAVLILCSSSLLFIYFFFFEHSVDSFILVSLTSLWISMEIADIEPESYYNYFHFKQTKNLGKKTIYKRPSRKNNNNNTREKEISYQE